MDEEYNDSFYPFIDYINETVSNIELEEDGTLPLYREIAWNFAKDEPIIVNNEFKIVEEDEAISVWIYHAIKTYRYVYSIYSWDFGSEVYTLIGKNYTPGFTKSECERYIKEALLINPYITSITNVDTTFEKDKLSVKVIAHTIYNAEEDSKLEVEFVV